MYIRRKVFSLIQNEAGEERYFSTTDFELDNGMEERYYSDDEEETSKNSRKLGKSKRGYGRSYFWGGIPAMIGVKKGQRAADKAAEEGLSDEEIIDAAKKKAGKTGVVLMTPYAAGLTAAGGLGMNYIAKNKNVQRAAIETLGKKNAKRLLKHGGLKGAAAGAILGGAAIASSRYGARVGAKKNTKERLKKGE